jgi:undecaprenyl-diphosphatase
LSWDRHLEHWIVGLRAGWLNWFFVGLSWIGTYGVVWIAIALLVALLWRRPSVLLTVVAADALADLLTRLGKVIVDRHRPFEHQLGPATSSSSFPSGHAATSFACATVLSVLVPRWRVPFFALATLIAFSRLYNGVHYPTDVLAGALLGVLIALLLLGAVRRRSRRATR